MTWDPHREDEARWVEAMRQRHARGQEHVCGLADVLRTLEERDEARAEVERLRRDLARCREAQRATAEGWRHEVAEVASIIGAPAHTAELAACVRAEVERLMRERDEAKEHARLAKMIASRVQAERDEARAEVEKLREAAASSMNLCSWECSDETYCGRCAPLVRALDQEQPEPEEDE